GGGSAQQRWLTWLVVLFTLASCGNYGLGWLSRELYGTVLRQDASKISVGSPVGGVYWLFVTLLPTYIYFRYPAKLLPIVALVISQLAAIGWYDAFRNKRPRLERVMSIFGAASGVAAFAIWCIGPGLFAFKGSGDSSLGP